MTTLQATRLKELRRLKELLEAQRLAEDRAEIESQKTSRYRTLARPNQLPPDGDWRIWLVISGRGFGKTFLGAGWLAEQARTHPGTEWAIVAPTFTDVRRTCVEGPSGFLKAANLNRAKGDFYNRSNGQITLSNGSRIHLVSADEPDRARGLNLSGAWLDEASSFRYEEIWTEGLAPALRIGNPQVVITTTPRPTKLIREWMSRTDGSVVVTRGSTFDNADNLSPAALAELKARYEGTRLGRQELYGELLLDTPGALFTQTQIDNTRVKFYSDFTRVVVAVDPAITNNESSDMTGIVVCGQGSDGRYYVLADRSCKDSPLGWAKRVSQAYEDYQADSVVVETNQGGDMIATTLHQVNPNLPIKEVSARRGKALRADPVALLYEQGKVSHIGNLNDLEDQMVTWLPDSGESPDRLDAMVHGITSLLSPQSKFDMAFAGATIECPRCRALNPKNGDTCRGCGHQFNPITPQREPIQSHGFPQMHTR